MWLPLVGRTWVASPPQHRFTKRCPAPTRACAAARWAGFICEKEPGFCSVFGNGLNAPTSGTRVKLSDVKNGVKSLVEFQGDADPSEVAEFAETAEARLRELVAAGEVEAGEEDGVTTVTAEDAQRVVIDSIFS